MTLSEAIKAGMNKAGISNYAELSKLSGVPIDTIKTYTSRKGKQHNPNMGFLRKISAIIDLRDFLNTIDSPTIGEVVPKLSLSNVPKSKKIVPKLSLSQKNSTDKSQNQPQTLNDDIVSIPFYEDIRASAGSGAYNEAETAEQLNFPKSFLRQYFGIISFNNLSIIVGKGDSMSPTLPESCYLLVQNGSVNDGEICIARLDDELYVKRLQKRPKLKLFSDNKNYEPIELEGENFEILGRVVGYFKKTAL